MMSLKMPWPKLIGLILASLALVGILLCSSGIFFNDQSVSHFIIPGVEKCYTQILAHIQNISLNPFKYLILFILFNLLLRLRPVDVFKNYIFYSFNGYIWYVHQWVGSFKVFNYLISALSQGKIHPKIF